MPKIRQYTKKELALLYFPNSEPRAAVAHLMSWINRCADLVDQLSVCHYRKTDKCFTPMQVELIIHYLGEPGE